MEFSENIQIRAIGNLLQYYASDLEYICNFKRFKESPIEPYIDIYKKNNPGLFQAFINEFRVARNVKEGKRRDLLVKIHRWVHSPKADDVDALAESIKNMTFQKTMISLSSKILFLNNPARIVPCDRLNRRALGLEKEKNYRAFDAKIQKMREEQRSLFQEWLLPVIMYLNKIESGFSGELKDFETIRMNRFIDKLLWMKGSDLSRMQDEVSD